MARRRTNEPVIESRVFSDIQAIDRGIKKLKRRIEEVQSLNPQQIQFNDQRINNVESNIKETIRDIFGQNSPEFHDHQYHDIWDDGHVIGMSEMECQHNFAAGISQTITMLEGLIQRLEERKLDLPSQVRPVPALGESIFIVHGHNNEQKESLARFIQHLDLQPIILHEKPNAGKTLIEKFEANADVGFAVVILTKDDMGGSKDVSSVDHKPRARQNVIFELGYFVGRLGRSRVCAIYEDDVELPSDIVGVAYVPWDASGGWKVQLIRELKAVGYTIDANKAFE